MLVGGHRYKIVVALHKITGNMTAFYLSNLIEVIKVTTGDHTYTTHLSNLIWNEITTLYTHFYFLLCAHKYFILSTSPRTKQIRLHLTILLFVITLFKHNKNVKYKILVAYIIFQMVLRYHILHKQAKKL